MKSVRHRDTETQSRKRKEAFHAISFPLFLFSSFPLFLCGSVALWLLIYMIFTRRFFILFAVGVLPLLFAWGAPGVKWGLVAYDLVLLFLAYVDYRRTEDVSQIEIA